MTGKELRQRNQINPDCTACALHRSCRTVCMSGRTRHALKGRRPRLLVFTDAPDYFADNAGKPYALDTGKLLDWMFRRMSVDPEDVGYEYTLHCYPKKDLPSTKSGRQVCIEECSQYRFATIAKIKPRAIAVLGTVSLEAFTGKSRVGDYEGRTLTCWEPVVREHCDTCWVGYSIAYCLVSPSDTYRVFRVLYMAAKDAGLNPKLNPLVPPFTWRKLLR